jgi:hypothetical protein
MKVKALRTKAAAKVVGAGLFSVTVKPVAFAAGYVNLHYDNAKHNIQTRYFKDHIAELSNQEKFDGVMAGLDINWIGDDIMDLACTVRHTRGNFDGPAIQRYMKAYDLLAEAGVRVPKDYVSWYWEAYEIAAKWTN